MELLMKKFLFILIFISSLISNMGCNNTKAIDTNDTFTINTDTTFIFTDNINNYDTVNENVENEFTVKAKKYDYEKNNVVILNIANKSDKNYTLTVDVTYHDVAGKVLAKESQSSEGFAANWQRYFLFKPDKAFSSYEYELTTEEFNGECFENKFTYKYIGIRKSPSVPIDWSDYTKGLGNGIVGDFMYRYDYSKPLDFQYTSVIFDNNGKIYHISNMIKESGEQPNTDLKIMATLSLGTKESIEIPKELTGNTNGILIFNNINTGNTSAS